jgi:hypothetical protein
MDVIEARIVRDMLVAPAVADPQHAAHASRLPPAAAASPTFHTLSDGE